MDEIKLLKEQIATLVQDRDALRAEKSGPYFGHYQQSLTKIARLKARVAELEGDAVRLDWLEWQINTCGAIHLHDGKHPHGNGLGLRPGYMSRTLRSAIDTAIAASKEAP